MIHTFAQRSPEWYAYKLGRISASRVSDIIARTKSGYSTSRANYRAELLCERLTGQSQEGFVNAAMQFGIDNEAEARSAYCFRYDTIISEVGFVDHPMIDRAGMSPDGIIGNAQALIEIKVPNTTTHIDTILSGNVPEKYLTQIMWQMACLPTAGYCDYVSYDPRLSENAKFFVKRIDRDPHLILKLEEEVQAFAYELERLCERVRQYGA